MRIALPVLVILLLGGAAVAGTSLELVDGRVLEGRSLERKDGLYLLQDEGGMVLPIPEQLVQRIRLTGEDAPPASGLLTTEPETLVGRQRPLPSRDELLGSLAGRQARFRQGVVDPGYRLSSDWELNAANNEFHPVRWYRAPIDPTWNPPSVLRADRDVTEFNPARWYRAPLDPTWWPRDGFASRGERADPR